MNVKEISNYLADKGCELIGCTKKEIAKIEAFFEVKLPSEYVDFLNFMGKSAGSFMQGSSCFYNEIFDLREGGISLLRENNFRLLPDKTFVFWMHQGYQFAFFYLDGEDNPPIYFYYEGRTKDDFEKKENSFTDFLEKHLVI